MLGKSGGASDMSILKTFGIVISILLIIAFISWFSTKLQPALFPDSVHPALADLDRFSLELEHLQMGVPSSVSTPNEGYWMELYAKGFRQKPSDCDDSACLCLYLSLDQVTDRHPERCNLLPFVEEDCTKGLCLGEPIKNIHKKTIVEDVQFCRSLTNKTIIKIGDPTSTSLC